MKAYQMKRPDGSLVVRIVNTNEIIKDKGVVLEKVGGPIGGSNILPLGVGEKDKFIPFRLDSGVEIKTDAEARKAYEEQNSLNPGEVLAAAAEPVKVPVQDDDEDEAPKRRGRQKKVLEEDDE